MQTSQVKFHSTVVDFAMDSTVPVSHVEAGERHRVGFNGEGLMVLGKTAASSVVITPQIAANIRKNLNKDGRRRRMLRPSLNLSPIKGSMELASSLKLQERKEDKLKAMRDEMNAAGGGTRRRRTLSPSLTSSMSSTLPMSPKAFGSLDVLGTSENVAGIDSNSLSPSRVPETVLTRAERIAKRVVPQRPPLGRRRKDSDDDNVSVQSQQQQQQQASKGFSELRERSAEGTVGGEETSNKMLTSLSRPPMERGSNPDSVRRKLGQITTTQSQGGSCSVLSEGGERAAMPPLAKINRSQSSKVVVEEEVPVAKHRLISNVSYKYKLYPGNNSLVITQAFRKRTWISLSKSENDVAKKAYKTTTSSDIEAGVKESKEADAAESIDFDIVWEQYRLAKRYKTALYKECVLNHIQGNPSLVTKKGLYFSIKTYCEKNGLELSDVVPRTFYLHADGSDPSEAGEGRRDDRAEFASYNRQSSAGGGGSAEESCAKEIEEGKGGKEENGDGIVWICKPSSLTNRGYGIVVLKGEAPVLNLVNRALTASPRLEEDGGDAEETDVKATTVENKKKRCAKKFGLKEGYIVQEYMTKPLLVRGRKFDIRCFVLLHLDKSKRGDKKLKAYFHEHMYVRTSGKKYSLNNLEDRECHLTNDAVQQKCASYGKFEAGNKLNMEDWQKQIDKDYPHAPADIVSATIIPRIKELTSISLSAALGKLEKTSVDKSFEILGYDYMVTDDFRPLLIEVNSNPCLEYSCPMLARMIPDVIHNMFKVSVDVLLPPPPQGSRTKNCEAAVAGIEGEKNLFEELPIFR
jgi:hypothetical protein